MSIAKGPTLRAHGICYDTGFFHRGSSTHEPFDLDHVRRDLRTIHAELHCDAVRITGGDRERLIHTATIAAEIGLEVWICPFTVDLSEEEMFDLLADCAEHGEHLRRQGAEVVLATGSELSVMNAGFLPGDTFLERTASLTESGSDLGRVIAAVPTRINAFLARAVKTVRERFGGRVTYCSLPFERVDWTPFDIIATDAGYRAAEHVDGYADGIRALVTQGKPVAITEFGCATHAGAADRGPRGVDIVEYDHDTARAVRLDGDYIRDEEGQARELGELLDIFEAEGVDTAFWYGFASYHLPHRTGRRADLDLASCGVVRVLDDTTWERKAIFSAMAERFAR